MRQETLLKVIIAVFAVILLILATFVYGNMQRSQQKTKTTQNTNQTSLETPKQTEKPPTTDTNNKTETPKTTQTKPTVTPAPAPVPTPAPTPSAPAKAEIPKAGGETAVLPMTILSVLGYLVYKSRRPIATISKSTLH